MSVRELCVCVCVLGLRRSDHHHTTPYRGQRSLASIFHTLNTFLSSSSSPPPPTIVGKKHRRFWTARPSKQASTRRTAPLAPASSEEPGRLLPPIHSFLPRSCHILDPLLHDRTESQLQLHTSTPLQPHHFRRTLGLSHFAPANSSIRSCCIVPSPHLAPAPPAAHRTLLQHLDPPHSTPIFAIFEDEQSNAVDDTQSRGATSTTSHQQ